MTIATRIKLYLIQNNISQNWVAEEAKIASPKLNASLNNKRKLSVEEFSRILEVLNIDANVFLKS